IKPFCVVSPHHFNTISNFGGGFQWKSEYPWYIIEVKSKHFPTVFKKTKKKKVTEKQEFLRKTSFRSNRFFYMVVIQKPITTTKIFDFYANFFLKCRSNFYEICRKRENLQIKNTTIMRLNFKFFRNRVTITIYPQTILNICYYSKSISRRYLKVLPFFGPIKILENFIQSSSYVILILRVENLIQDFSQNLNSGVFRPLKHKPPFSPTIRNDILG
ncbi:hypothetical protein AGLY_008750, partial [Aphis glycines]